MRYQELSGTVLNVFKQEISYNHQQFNAYSVYYFYMYVNVCSDFITK